MIEVVTGLVFSRSGVLMCQRRKEKYLGLHWEFPGGKVDEGETLIDALKRELYEELRITVHSPIEWMTEVMSYDNGMTYHVTFYLVHSYDGEPVNTEFEEIRWIPKDELNSLLHLSGNKRIIDRLLREGYPQ